MSDKEKNSGWTLGTLYIHFNRLLREKDKRDKQRWEAGQEAIKHVNEVRTEITKIRSETMPREETDRAIKALEDRIHEIKHWQDERGGMFMQADKSTASVRWHMELVVAIVAAAVGGLIGFILKR